MVKRSIRLKEIGVSVNKFIEPSDEYLSNCPKLEKNEKFYLATNEDGNQFGVSGNRSDNKIFWLGASSVESMYIKYSLRPHVILENRLLENGYDYEVFNLGASGTQLLNIINLLINKLSNVGGSTVILSLPSNDNGPLLYKDGYFTKHRHHATVLPATELRVPTNSELDLSLYEKNIGLINVICKQLNLKLIITSICYTTNVDNLKTLNDVARNYCKANQIKFLDLESDLQSKPNYFYDKLHFLPLGSNFIAHQVFNFIKDGLNQDSQKNFQVYFFKKTGQLEKEMMWSEKLKVTNKSVVRLLIDFKHLGESRVPALFAIDYNCDPIKTDLIKSKNKEIGYFKYVSGEQSKRLENIYEIYIPENCSEIKVGLRSWSSEGIFLYEAKITVLT